MLSMHKETWGAVDRYLADLLQPEDVALDAALGASTAAGLPAINVSSHQGRLLQLLAQTLGARRILEIGTLGGYSTIWMARGLGAGGRLTTLEAEPRHAEVAASNIARAGLAAVVEIIVGPALKTLPGLLADGRDPFDLVFIDADKPSTAEYFDWAVQLSRPGALIVVDNVVRGGAVVDPKSADENVQGMRRFHERLAARAADVSATVIQTVGAKGHDGFALARLL